jgi:hypothetical protein
MSKRSTRALQACRVRLATVLPMKRTLKSKGPELYALSDDVRTDVGAM